MSRLVVRRKAIARALAGELAPAEEQGLRAHLARCARCRAHYDRLALAAEAIATSAGGEARVAARRERARLEAALAGASGGALAAPAPRRRARRWLPAALALAPAAAAIVWIVRVAPPPSPGDAAPAVTFRGGAPDGAAPPAGLLVYASRKEGAAGHGPVRLVADLPASGEGRLSLSDYMQLSVRGLRAPAFVTVVGVDDGGEVHVYVPRPGAAPARAAPRDAPASLGPSIDLGRGHRPGRLRLYALVSGEPLDEARVRAAAARLDRGRPGAPPLDLPVPQVAGLLMIEP
jgi:hypothetical protein